MTTLGHHGILLGMGSIPPGATLFDELMADSPVNYWRNGEASGLVMVDEVAADGVYVGPPTLGAAAIYTGGGTTATGFGSSNNGYSTVFPSSLAAMTLVSVIYPTGLSGTQPIGPQRDQGSGSRMWQWRTNGSGMEFVKIAGGVAVVNQPTLFTNNNPYIIAFEVDASGNYAMYVNGTSVKSGTIAAADYGGAGNAFQIGYSDGMAAAFNGRTCENAVFDYAVGPARQAIYATAAGL